MTPLQVIERLFVENRPAAILILTGLAVAAAAAVYKTMGFDDFSGLLIGIYIVGIGLLLYLVAVAFSNSLIQTVLSWFLALLLMAVTTTFLLAAIVPGWNLTNPIYCLAQFWRPCDAVSEEIAKKTPPLPPLAPAEVPASINRAAYTVYVQFAGVIQEDSVRKMNVALAKQGWRVPNAAGGGERLSSASGFNEVRYSDPADEPVAKALAAEVTAANVGSSPVSVRRMSIIKPKTLEVWISR